ncbi:MAG: hypothetical protein IJ804_00980 [Prevotella sp.]|nr:hypothetical protein [Prevotella sp.]
METIKEYQKPEMEIVKIATAGILAASNDVTTNPSGTDWGDEEEEG